MLACISSQRRMLSASEPDIKDSVTYLPGVSNNISGKHFDLWLPSLPRILNLVQSLPHGKCHSGQPGAVFTDHTHIWVRINSPLCPLEPKLCFISNKGFK